MFLLTTVFLLGFLLYCFRYARASNPPHLNLDQIANLKLNLDEKITPERLCDAIAAPYGLKTPEQFKRLGICVALVAIAMRLVGPGMRAFERSGFNYGILSALAVLLFSVATTCYDLIAIWSSLKALLEQIEQQASPEKTAFQRITKHLPRRLVFWFLEPALFHLVPCAKEIGRVKRAGCCGV
jgi:hypothetical protein